MQLEKYKNTGWGLSIKAFTALCDALGTLPEINAIEFGSGISTAFLEDYAQTLEKKLTLDSFDNDKKYKHASAHLATLVQCNDANYQTMFKNGDIDWSLFKKRWWKPKSRQRNCFYNLQDYKLKPHYNLAVIDGPHGNGRNFAYLLLKGKLKDGFLLIDDFNHYDFVETASQFFTLEEITRVEEKKDNFILFRVL